MCDDEVLYYFENWKSYFESKIIVEFIKNCLLLFLMLDMNELCYVVEEIWEISFEELLYDDSEIVWGKENVDYVIIVEVFFEEEEE